MLPKYKTIALSVMLLMVLPCFLAFAGAKSDARTLVQDNSAFAFDLYQKLRTSEGNLFFSPYSISIALAMTYAGARGHTEKQMAKALRFSLDQKKLHPAFAELESRLNSLQKAGNIKLSVANSLWPQQDCKFLDEYLSLTKKYYGVSITPVDYKRAREAARKMINKWVEDKTQDKIKNLIQPGILDALTRLVLVNAIYFKGNWESQFEVSQTKDALFFVSSERSVQTPMMSQKHKFRYAEFESLQILELPYVGNELSMLVLLPREADGLKELESRLSVENLKQWKSRLSMREVLVFLPKFKMTSKFRLDKTLVSMGMVDAFSHTKANFAGMDGRPDWLYIGAVIHQAFVDVNEEGTEAAAATAVVMEGRGRPVPPPIFRADHPFVFLVQENQTGSILFIGKLTDPTKTGNIKNQGFETRYRSEKTKSDFFQLNAKSASHFARLALKCIKKEFPNKLSHVMNDESEVQNPASLHPAFYGCFDWHSSVHGHWMLVRILKEFPDLPEAREIRSSLKNNLSAENIEVEVKYLHQPNRKSFERTYGWAWLLKLAEELYGWDDPEGKKWSKNLQPLADAVVKRYLEFLPKQTYPIRRGVHPNTAFGIAFALDYARAVGHKEMEDLLIERSNTYFAQDSNCPAGWEPDGDDFFSRCLIEADLMRRVLSPVEFSEWFHLFLPQLANKEPKSLLEPANVSDRSDPKIVHLDGLNLSRAWCMNSIAYVLPEDDPIRKVLTESAIRHAKATLPYIASGSYEGEHWLASFVVYMLSVNNKMNSN